MKKCSVCGAEYPDSTTLCQKDGTPLVKPADDLINQVLSNKYRIEERISKGGMGAVYRATHILMDKTVAIKILHPALAADEKVVARFTREARAASRINHPHAVNVTDFGESETGIVFLVMEYLHGRTIKEVIRTEGPLSLKRVAAIIAQVAGALEAAHAQGVVHRDLKSENIMLENINGDSDWAKVLDFGIAKVNEPVSRDQALTEPNLIIGTPQYMSPEQCAQTSEIDSRSDIYSLGIIVFEMLSGRTPFIDDSPTAIILKQLQESPPSILNDRPDLPAEMEAIIEKVLSKKPEERYQTAAEFSNALSAAAKLVTNEAGQQERSAVPYSTAERGKNIPDDEVTVVHPRAEQFKIPPAKPQVHKEPFNPWRIAGVAALCLLGLFGIMFALSGGFGSRSDPAAEQLTEEGVTPVAPASPPSGTSENVVTVSPTADPSPEENNPQPDSSPATGETEPKSDNEEKRREEREPEPASTPAPDAEAEEPQEDRTSRPSRRATRERVVNPDEEGDAEPTPARRQRRRRQRSEDQLPPF